MVNKLVSVSNIVINFKKKNLSKKNLYVKYSTQILTKCYENVKILRRVNFVRFFMFFSFIVCFFFYFFAASLHIYFHFVT